MKDKLAKIGIINKAELTQSAAFPSEERLRRGPIAVIECLQEIPCNPCEFVCPEKAIEVGKPITNLPRFLEDRCTGCGLCIPHCPGLAIFVVDLSYSEHEAVVQFPFEFLPLPAVGDEVNAVDREGIVIAKGKVKAVRNPQRFDKTPVISVIVPKEFAMEVRSAKISPRSKVLSPKSKINNQIKSKNLWSRHRTSDVGRRTTIVCRCEEVSGDEIMQAVKEEAPSLKAVKNRTRTGMGLCQGRICAKIATGLISENAGIPPENIKPPTVRPPVRPIALDQLATGKEDD